MEQLVIDAVFGFVVAWAIAKFVIGPLLQWRLDRELGEAKRVLEDLESETLIALTVETHGDEFLCYNSFTQDFVCQGRNLKEIAERFALRYPDKSAALYQGDDQAMTVLRSQLKEQRENLPGFGSAP